MAKTPHSPCRRPGVGPWSGGFPGGSDGKEFACGAGDLGLIPGLGRSPGEGNGNPLWYSCLENPMNGGAWQATVHGAEKSRPQLSDFTLFQELSHMLQLRVCMPQLKSCLPQRRLKIPSAATKTRTAKNFFKKKHKKHYKSVFDFLCLLSLFGI